MNSPLDGAHAGDLLSALAAVARLPLSEARLGRVTRLLLNMEELGQSTESAASERAPTPARTAAGSESREVMETPEAGAKLPSPSDAAALEPAASPAVAAPAAAAAQAVARPPEGLALLKVQTPQGATNISVPHALLHEVAARLGGLPAAKALARQLAAQAPAAGRSGWVQEQLKVQALTRS